MGFWEGFWLNPLSWPVWSLFRSVLGLVLHVSPSGRVLCLLGFTSGHLGRYLAECSIFPPFGMLRAISEGFWLVLGLVLVVSWFWAPFARFWAGFPSLLSVFLSGLFWEGGLAIKDDFVEANPLSSRPDCLMVRPPLRTKGS